MVTKLNTKLASIHYYIENTLGICKDRFRILNHPLEYTKEDVVQASFPIIAIFILHNFLIKEKDDSVIEQVVIDSNDDRGLSGETSEDIDEVAIRNILL